MSSVLFCAIMITAAAAAEYRVIDDVAFVAEADGTSQQYVIAFPDGFDREQVHDVCIALHGHGSDRWQFVKEPRDECRAIREVALAHAMVFVSPDYRAKTSWMGPKAEADVVQIIGDLKKAYRVGRVFVCGGSMGASSALTFTALHPDLVAGVVCLNGTANHIEYTQFQDAIQESFGGTKADCLLEYKNRSAEYWPERFTMPVAITAGGKDESVPAASSLRLAAILKLLNRPVLLLFREDGGHATNYDDSKAAFEFVIANSKP